MIEQIESPMKMNYRESYAWQLGYAEGWKQAKEEESSKLNNLKLKEL